ncbi:MAG: translation factor SUA5, partial [Clostridia bacterium]|nr:translation factor SUA5 [Clostridia bacterium]
IEAIIDDGECDIGLESTVVSIKEGVVEILRPGRVTYEELKTVADKVIINGAVKNECTDKKPASPGMKYRHYSPSAPVYLVCGDDDKVIEFFLEKQEKENCGILCFDGDTERLSDKNVLTFGNADDEQAQAHLLFDRLRKFDSMDVEKIYARMSSERGLGLAVYNRLIRAAGFEIINV